MRASLSADSSSGGRITAFQEIQDKLGDQQYWETLSWIWQDTEFPFSNLDDWIRLWSSPRKLRGCVMDHEERKVLKGLDSSVIIYRGTHDEEHVNGLSWTLKKEKAEFFAHRFRPNHSLLATATISKRHILAYLTGRNEDEIVCLPCNVRNFTITQI